MQEVETVTIDKDECPVQFVNIITQCKTTYPADDEIQKLDNVDRMEIRIFRR